MYGDNYGYRSGLNDSMVRHLTAKIALLERMANLKPDDTVLDIGSNDATSLKAYSVQGLHRVGIDPTARKFAQYYPSDIAMVPDFFSRAVFERVSPRRARIVTSVQCSTILRTQLPSPATWPLCSRLTEFGIWNSGA